MIILYRADTVPIMNPNIPNAMITKSLAIHTGLGNTQKNFLSELFQNVIKSIKGGKISDRQLHANAPTNVIRLSRFGMVIARMAK